MLLEISREITPEKNEGMEAKQKQYPVVDVTGDRNKVRCCKEQYCIGTWNVRSMNQGKLEVVKQKMARVNIDILEIGKLKWTGWVNLTQMTIISTTMGRNHLEEMEYHRGQQKSLKCSTWMQSKKRQNELCSFPRQTIQYHRTLSLCPSQ